MITLRYHPDYCRLSPYDKHDIRKLDLESLPMFNLEWLHKWYSELLLFHEVCYYHIPAQWVMFIEALKSLLKCITTDHMLLILPIHQSSVQSVDVKKLVSILINEVAPVVFREEHGGRFQNEIQSSEICLRTHELIHTVLRRLPHSTLRSFVHIDRWLPTGPSASPSRLHILADEVPSDPWRLLPREILTMILNYMGDNLINALRLRLVSRWWRDNLVRFANIHWSARGSSRNGPAQLEFLLTIFPQFSSIVLMLNDPAAEHQVVAMLQQRQVRVANLCFTHLTEQHLQCIATLPALRRVSVDGISQRQFEDLCERLPPTLEELFVVVRQEYHLRSLSVSFLAHLPNLVRLSLICRDFGFPYVEDLPMLVSLKELCLCGINISAEKRSMFQLLTELTEPTLGPVIFEHQDGLLLPPAVEAVILEPYETTFWGSLQWLTKAESLRKVEYACNNQHEPLEVLISVLPLLKNVRALKLNDAVITHECILAVQAMPSLKKLHLGECRFDSNTYSNHHNPATLFQKRISANLELAVSCPFLTDGASDLEVFLAPLLQYTEHLQFLEIPFCDIVEEVSGMLKTGDTSKLRSIDLSACETCCQKCVHLLQVQCPYAKIIFDHASPPNPE